MTTERLAEIRELHKDATEGFECCGRHVIEAFGEALAEVDRLRKQVATLIEDRAHWKGHAEEHQHALHLMMLTCNEERVRADVAEEKVDRLRAKVAAVEDLMPYFSTMDYYGDEIVSQLEKIGLRKPVTDD